jgi:hypothetical protein
MWRDRQFRSMRRVVSTVPKWTPYVRANTLLTDFAYHAPPRGVLMPFPYATPPPPSRASGAAADFAEGDDVPIP